MYLKAGFSIAVMLGVVFAGCLGGGSGPDDVGPADPSRPAGFDDASGGVEGIVTDEEARPVADAQVGILNLGMEARTDDTGRFVFSNVAPGRAAIVVQKLGYESASVAVQVVAGEVQSVSITLVAIVLHDAYHESWVENGYFECSWRGIVSAGGPCFFPITGTESSIVPVDPWTNNKREFNFEAKEGVMTVLVEMRWTQTTAATGDQMSLFMSYVGRETNHWYCDAAGPSPFPLRWDRGELDADEGDCATGGSQLPGGQPGVVPIEGQELTVRANTGPGGAPFSTVGFGMAVQQSFEVFFSMYYWEEASPDATGIPDA